METRRDEILIELGKRLHSRREEAGLDVAALARRAVVETAAITRFERGQGGLGAGSLARIANALGVPLGGLLSVATPPTPAPKQSSALLFTRRLAELLEGDRETITESLERARHLVTLNNILGQTTIQEGWGVTRPLERHSHVEGYDRAQRIRTALADKTPSDKPIRNLRKLIEDRFAILVRETTFSNHNVLGASCRSGPARLILVAATIAHDSDLRLAMAHELAHHLMDLEGDSGVIDASRHEEVSGELTGSFSMETEPQEQRAKAFAVMFLAPRAAVQLLLGPPRHLPIGDDARRIVRTVRHELGIGFDAAAWHLKSLGYLANQETVEALLSAPDRDEISGFEERSGLDGLERRAREALFADEISEARYRSLLDLPYDALLS